MALTFGEWLADELQARDMKQIELAERIGVGGSTISRWLSGENVPNGRHCAAIAEVLGLEINDVRERAGLRPLIGSVPPDQYDMIRTMANDLRGLREEVERLRRRLDGDDEQG